MFNPIIVAAVLAQMALGKASRTASAIAGFAITTGILLWGLSLYANGDQIAFFGVPLSESAFLLVCVVWYGFDTRALRATRRVEQPAPMASE